MNKILAALLAGVFATATVAPAFAADAAKKEEKKADVKAEKKADVKA